jgi:hypothetical protein
LRELADAVAVIKVLKGEVMQLRNLIAQGSPRQRKTDRPERALSVADTNDGTINALIANAGWLEKKPGVGTGQATATVDAEPAPPQENVAPDLVFTAKDKTTSIALLWFHSVRAAPGFSRS